MSQPKTHSRTFRVRNYECDPYGHMNNVNYLRYMQETAFDASAAAGYDFKKYSEIGLTWMIRETEIHHHTPLHYQDHVNLKTWIGDFRKVRSKRFYQFRLDGQTELIAEATTDWVLLDRTTQRPAEIPAEMRENFWPNYKKPEPSKRDPFPPAPTAPARPYAHLHQVTWADIDGFHHLNNANYLLILQNAGTYAAQNFGWGLKRMLDLGLGWVQRSLRIKYKAQPRLDDILETTTFLQQIRRTLSRRWFSVRNQATGEMVSRAYIDYVLVDIASGRPVRNPEGLMADFADHIVM